METSTVYGLGKCLSKSLGMLTSGSGHGTSTTLSLKRKSEWLANTLTMELKINFHTLWNFRDTLSVSLTFCACQSSQYKKTKVYISRLVVLSTIWLRRCGCGVTLMFTPAVSKLTARTLLLTCLSKLEMLKKCFPMECTCTKSTIPWSSTL